MDLKCKCLGVDRRTTCPRKASEEDGLCTQCRENDCENTPLARFMQKTDELRDLPNAEWKEAFDRLAEEYRRECAEKGVQP